MCTCKWVSSPMHRSVMARGWCKNILGWFPTLFYFVCKGMYVWVWAYACHVALVEVRGLLGVTTLYLVLKQVSYFWHCIMYSMLVVSSSSSQFFCLCLSCCTSAGFTDTCYHIFTWVPGFTLRLSGLGYSFFAHQTFSPAPGLSSIQRSGIF
jgi:hypothetical protein